MQELVKQGKTAEYDIDPDNLTFKSKEGMEKAVLGHFRYITNNFGPLNSPAEVKLAVFMPAALKHKNNPDYVIGSHSKTKYVKDKGKWITYDPVKHEGKTPVTYSELVAIQNSSLDTDKDGLITIKDIKSQYE